MLCWWIIEKIYVLELVIDYSAAKHVLKSRSQLWIFQSYAYYWENSAAPQQSSRPSVIDIIIGAKAPGFRPVIIYYYYYLNLGIHSCFAADKSEIIGF